MINHGRRPYIVEISARPCNLHCQVKDFGAFRHVGRAFEVATGYWSIYLGFFGDQIPWINVTVTDARDGRIIWKSGQLMEGATGNERQEYGVRYGRGKATHPRKRGRF